MEGRMTKKPSRQYDEFRHFGVDFSNQEEVRAYDSKQGTTIEKESQLVTGLGIQPEQSLMEFGCGTGCFAIAAAQNCRSVRAVDVSKAMLEYTSNRAEELGLRNLVTCHAGFLSYQHTGEPVDWIVTKYTLHHLPDAWKLVALININDCLAPDGSLFLRDVVFSFPPSEYARHYPDCRSFAQFTGRVLDGRTGRSGQIQVRQAAFLRTGV